MVGLTVSVQTYISHVLRVSNAQSDSYLLHMQNRLSRQAYIRAFFSHETKPIMQYLPFRPSLFVVYLVIYKY